MVALLARQAHPHTGAVAVELYPSGRSPALRSRGSQSASEVLDFRQASSGLECVSHTGGFLISIGLDRTVEGYLWLFRPREKGEAENCFEVTCLFVCLFSQHMIKYRYIPFTHGKRRYKGKEDVGKTFAS